MQSWHYWPLERRPTLICKRYQVMDFVSVGMNAASVGDGFRMLLKRVTSESSFEIFQRGVITSEQWRRNNNNNNKNQEEKKEIKRRHL